MNSYSAMAQSVSDQENEENAPLGESGGEQEESEEPVGRQAEL